MKISLNLQTLHNNGVKVYPVIDPVYKKLKVEVYDEFKVVYAKTKTTSKTLHSTQTINAAIEKTVTYIANKITTLHANHD